MESQQGKRKRTLSSETTSDSGPSGSSVSSGINLINCFDEKSNELTCPICFELIEDAQVTECGHTFCSRCISYSLETSNHCPVCNHDVDKVFPNFMLNDIVTKKKRNLKTKKSFPNQEPSKALLEWQQLIAIKTASLNRNEIDMLLTALNERKKECERTSKVVQTELLRGFLNQARKHKYDQLKTLMNELKIIEKDTARLEKLASGPSTSHNPAIDQTGELSETVTTIQNSASSSHQKSTEESTNKKQINNGQSTSETGPNDNHPDVEPLNSTLSVRWKKMKHHFEDLELCYLNTRTKSVFGKTNSDGESKSTDGLEEFRETLNKITSCNNLRPLSTLCYTRDPINEPSIVSSIEFDKDNEIFATAGVTKIIKLFDYSTVIKDSLTINYPIAVMECKSKISCVSWSSYYKSSMATSDYEGAVTIWDVFTKQTINCFQEHEKRCWSVDFNKIDTHLIISGSDDGTVKLWSLNMDSSIATLKASANVCCVKFNPRSRYHVAFASADHCAYYYDLRNPKTPEAVFKGHRKAVSYVKFLNWDEIISASTDSQLKMWNTNKNQCLRTFKGHVNEKNFVGLATDGDYISCGSENNSLFLYYKGFSKPILVYSFDSDKVVHPFQLKDRSKKDGLMCDFVSAICWKLGENVIIAANSQGIIKILELV